MQDKKHNRIKIFSSLTFFIVFLILLISVSTYFKNSTRPSKAFHQFLSAFRTNENYLNKTLDDVQVLLSDSIANPEKLFSVFPSDLYEQSGILIIIYKHDSLIYWSDNSVPFSAPDPHFNDTLVLLELPNGWFLSKSKECSDFFIQGLCLIKTHYPYQNEFLQNNFQKNYRLPPETKILNYPSYYNVYSTDDEFLFSLEFPSTIPLSEQQLLIIFFIYVLLFISFTVLLFQLYQQLTFFIRNKLLFIISYAFDLILIRFLLFYFKIPGILYTSLIFNSQSYAFSGLFPSIGDLLLNVIVLLSFSFVFYLKFRSENIKTKKSVLFRYFTVFTLFLHICIFFELTLILLKSLVYDADFSLNLSNIFSISIYSVLGITAFASLLFSFFLIASRLFDFAYKHIRGNPLPLFLLLFISSMVFFLYNFFFENFDIVATLFLLVFIASLFIIKHQQKKFISFYSTIFFIFLFSVFSTYFLEINITSKEKAERRLLAFQLSKTFNPLIEYNFQNARSEIKNDTLIGNYLTMSLEDPSYEDSVLTYLDKVYYQNIFPGFELYSTVCYPEKILNILPDNIFIDCNDYFNDLINDYGSESICKNLYRYNLNDVNGYISRLDIPVLIPHDTIHFTIFSELFSSFFSEEGLGYPELLIDESIRDNPDIGLYSYARYLDGNLIYKFGSYFYNLDLSGYGVLQNESFFYHNDYNHFFLAVDNIHHLLLSKKKPSFLDYIAPFSYLLLFYAVFVLLFLFIFVYPFGRHVFDFNFRSRLQLSVITIIIIAFIIIGFTSISYIRNLNTNKNFDNLREKSHSVLIELEHKLADEPYLSVAMQPYLSSLLNKFSLVFFSDINLYDLSGNLLATSRPKIFEKGLISDKMNSLAFKKLALDKNLLYVHHEKIGSYKYLSAYIPFRNSQNIIVAYLNLPYFAKQTELRNEIAYFMTTFLNIYIFFIALSIFLTLLVSRYATRPLQLIRDKMRSLSLGLSNEKIDWESNDEIGQLIREYNRMIDELVKSAELLAKSERESAWREMAKQVAHEIKNPLTPMKLSVQYLKKAWDEKSSDFNKLLDRFTKTIIEQIDSLSTIATEFSDFAKMPPAKSENVRLIDIINNSLDLFKDIYNINFSLKYDTNLNYIIYIDKKQLLRAFNNLIQNSVEAIGTERPGTIEITVLSHSDHYEISIVDDGPGIPNEQAGNIFSPSFTTKSGGMGLGLAIVKSIIINAGGDIAFVPGQVKGATFVITLPKVSTGK